MKYWFSHRPPIIQAHQVDDFSDPPSWPPKTFEVLCDPLTTGSEEIRRMRIAGESECCNTPNAFVCWFVGATTSLANVYVFAVIAVAAIVFLATKASYIILK